MADGQTGHMHQVAEPGPSPGADHYPMTMPGWTPGLDLLPHPPAEAARCGILPFPSLRATGRASADGVNRAAVENLVALLLRDASQDLLDRHLAGHLDRGLSVDDIYLRLFQPAARRLGDLWVDDLCSFVDVTLAMALLQTSLRRLAPRFQRQARSVSATRSVFLATLGGDQHTFGLAMAAEFFRRSGWCVCASPGGPDALASQLAGERHAVVGFSVSRVDQLPELAARIATLRRMGRTRIAGVLVGGPLVATRPDCARDVGADGAGFDALKAVADAEALAASAGDLG